MQEVDLTKPFKNYDFLLKKEIKASCTKNQHLELSNVHPDDTKHEESITKPKPETNFIENVEIPPIPKTAVQFVINWRRYTSSDFRYKYLKVLINFLHIKYDSYRNLK